jgi:hypothetical protein
MLNGILKIVKGLAPLVLVVLSFLIFFVLAFLFGCGIIWLGWIKVGVGIIVIVVSRIIYVLKFVQ